MPAEIGSRIVLLVGLAALGIAIAGVGTAIGLPSPISDDGTDPTFVVADGTITDSDSKGDVIVVENTSHVHTIRIDRTDSTTFLIRTDSEPPLTKAARERSRRIALENRSVQRALASLEGYTVSVDSVRRINRSELIETQITATNVTQSEADTGIYSISSAAVESEPDSVIERREPTCVENRTVVDVRCPTVRAGADLQYRSTWTCQGVCYGRYGLGCTPSADPYGTVRENGGMDRQVSWTWVSSHREERQLPIDTGPFGDRTPSDRIDASPPR